MFAGDPLPFVIVELPKIFQNFSYFIEFVIYILISVSILSHGNTSPKHFILHNIYIWIQLYTLIIQIPKHYHHHHLKDIPLQILHHPLQIPHHSLENLLLIQSLLIAMLLH